ncbi:30S ribosomal protein S13 [Candidatus Wolfebacteria bacterium CG10_big_fil_rev_8_21_14_0_10_31_9]|uniref:Small ribosomal subunit protein uS13 n=1 Tax=Candidatus Wolfebacteria bacterium CG10_big_fil_rev_8_21_14_0_10_31_9 TaxID=1975070 RepID=A0A2H0RC44_9BACT|nr:MAG: 30S ribosomal protein S13 [Candidatus Wolfebacteria bacterium CG10_big_fil_rev_8_21_14_0_10_31_9]
MRIAGTTIPDNKKAIIALRYIFGVGPTLAVKILELTKVDGNKKAKDLTSDDIKKIQDFIEKNYKVEGELRQVIKTNVSRLKEIGSYRGSRHQKKLPTRGQRTKTNTRTVRGNVRKTAGSGKRKAGLK